MAAVWLLLAVLLAAVWGEGGEGVCVEEQREESCGVEEATAGGEVKWHQLDWPAYQALDLDDEDRKDPTRRFALQVVTSAGLAPNRTLPDLRDPACLALGPPSFPLPDVSVIITYRNEPRSTLLRTLVSVLERSPKDVLREIILVDDNNEDESVGREVAGLEKVRLLWNPQREGLIYADDFLRLVLFDFPADHCC